MTIFVAMTDVGVFSNVVTQFLCAFHPKVNSKRSLYFKIEKSTTIINKRNNKNNDDNNNNYAPKTWVYGVTWWSSTWRPIRSTRSPMTSTSSPDSRSLCSATTSSRWAGLVAWLSVWWSVVVCVVECACLCDEMCSCLCAVCWVVCRLWVVWIDE